MSKAIFEVDDNGVTARVDGQPARRSANSEQTDAIGSDLFVGSVLLGLDIEPDVYDPDVFRVVVDLDDPDTADYVADCLAQVAEWDALTEEVAA